MIQEIATTPVLIVDDDPGFSELLVRMLEEEGLTCELAGSGAEALQCLNARTYSLLLSDVCMPGISGLELLDLVQEKWPGMAVIMVSGMDDRDTALEALEKGAFGYVVKPFQQIEIVIQVANALRLRALEQAHIEHAETLEKLVRERTLELEEAYRNLKENHQKMVEQEKLASVGQLAAGVAHEVNNPTGYIASNLTSLQKFVVNLIQYQTALQELAEKSASPEDLEQLRQRHKELKVAFIVEDLVDLIQDSLDGTERIKKIVQGLKNFSRKGPEERQSVDINQVLEETLALAWNEVKTKARVVKDLQPLPRVYGYPQRLSQVFMNLIINAAHAIEEQGEIRLETGFEQGQVQIRIADSGCGIPAENLEKIFEPFFTTKEVGVGTGLGLSILSEIMEEHEGEMGVESEVGRGTTFTLRLPPEG